MSAETSNNLTMGQIVGLVASLFVLICFFMPWIELNMLIVSANLSGYQLATGSGPAGSSFPGVPSLLLLPLGMLAVVGIVSSRLLGKGAAAPLQKISPLVLIAVGGLSVAILLYQYINLNAQFNQNVFGLVAQNVFSYSFGAGASLFGSLIVAAGGLLDLRAATATRIPQPDENRR
jgi:hypothetical protein